ncbi:NTP transferase domain-containing protein [Streptomyces olivaceus]|uniref:nucleotidyltransferase family protein n=1 Tax=Streptomyces olivaceus TaxID=47716 RepID=UPI00382EBB3B
MFVAGILLAAGSSRRLGQPKQLLPLRGATLLDAALAAARACRFDQLLLALGGSAEAVRHGVDMSGAEQFDVERHGDGCGASVAAAMGRVDPRADGVVLLLGDQPGVRPMDVAGLLGAVAGRPAGLCRYRDGPGHPLWFGRELFGDLAALHGDKAVWKLLGSGRSPVVEHPVDRPAPRDVDTWEDYWALVAEVGR